MHFSRRQMHRLLKLIFSCFFRSIYSSFVFVTELFATEHFLFRVLFSAKTVSTTKYEISTDSRAIYINEL